MENRIFKKMRFMVFVFALMLLIGIANAAMPTPHGIDGFVYELDGITQVKKGTDFYVKNLNKNHMVQGKTGKGSKGRYSVSIKGDDGDTIEIKAWNKYNQVNTTFALSGVMRNIYLLLNMTFPPLEPNITSQPILSATEDSPYSYQIEALDENEDVLDFSLIIYPSGMTINGSTGLINWTPAQSHVGSHNVTIQVSDGLFLVNHSFLLNVSNVNDLPSIISVVISNATQDVAYFYDVDATDEDSDVLNFTLLVSPQGMTINSSTGLINWTPNSSQVGSFEISVSVDDGIAAVFQNFTISVANVNDLPAVSSLPVTTAKQDILYNYDVDAYDVDNDILSYSLIKAPEGMKINSSNGNITWLPGNDDVGIVNITVNVSDDRGNVLQPFALTIENVNDRPIINSTPKTEATEGKAYSYDAEAYDIDKDVLKYSLLTAPSGMAIDSITGLIEWVPKGEHRGNNTIIVQVNDTNLTDAQQFYIYVYEASAAKSESRGGGGSRTAIPSKSDPVAVGEIKDEAGKPIVEVRIPAKNAVIKIEEFHERPRGIQGVPKKVYKYLKIEVEDAYFDDAIINFVVDRLWLGENEINPNDVVLTHYTLEGWRDLFSEKVNEDESYIYYTARTSGFSFFAITVKEGVITKSISKPQISKVNTAYRIAGTIHRYGGFRQATQGTRFIVENLNTSESFIAETGIGPNSGAFMFLLHGKIGDSIRIRTIDGIEDFITTLVDNENLELMLNSKSTGFIPLKYSFASIIKKSLAFTVLLMVAAALFFIRRRPKNILHFGIITKVFKIYKKVIRKNR